MARFQSTHFGTHASSIPGQVATPAKMISKDWPPYIGAESRNATPLYTYALRAHVTKVCQNTPQPNVFALRPDRATRAHIEREWLNNTREPGA